MNLEIITIIMIFIGISFVVIGGIINKREKKDNDILYKNMSETFDLVNVLFNDVQDESNNFNELAESVFNEMEEKQSELQHLYNMIRETKEQYGEVKPSVDAPKINEKVAKPTLNTPKARKIYEFADSGMTNEEIAKKLRIGKGEVELLQNLRGV
ncbi:MAG: DUF6115 domain-containing protein [Lachnospirales bacterium]